MSTLNNQAISQPILYFDMDNVLVDFQSGVDKLPPELRKADDMDNIKNIFSLMEPVDGALDAVNVLRKYFDIYILSTCPWGNLSGASQKIAWVKKYFGDDKASPFYKRIILTHHKNLNKGDYLIDDRTARGVDKFEGEHIHFGTEKFPDWPTVVEYLLSRV